MSNHTEGNRGPGRPKAGAPNAPTVDIKLDQHFRARVYTSGSTVTGNAVINCPNDTPFQAFIIMFTGIAATRLDYVQSFASNAVRNFMKLRMPLSASDLPSPRVFKAGVTYNVPFHFVVPHQLTMGACRHGDTPPVVQDQHLRMPPTLGCWDGDDQAPNMTHIEYAVQAKFTCHPHGGDPDTLISGKKQIKVLPATPEDPPLDITSRDERYCLSKTKAFRKNLVGAKAGELTASSSQPEAVMIHADGYGAEATTARINLEFAPTTEDATPPKINSVSGKLVSTTYFGGNTLDSLPNLGPKNQYAQNHVLTYSGTTNLFNNRVEKVDWSQHNVAESRRGSSASSEGLSEETPSEGEEDQQPPWGRRGSFSRNKRSRRPLIRHRATLEMPVHIPVSNKRTFVPTFHSCIMTRAYVLQLILTVGPSNTTMTLNVPLQLGVQQLFDVEGEELPSFEAAMAQAQAQEAEAFGNLRPSIANTPAMPSRRAVLPRYNEISGQIVAVV